jgi:hypothetical protein
MRDDSGMFYDRNGQPMSFEEWADSRARGDFHIDDTWIGDTRISTIWLGLDSGIVPNVPLTFETMIFNGPADLDGKIIRYATEQQAARGHQLAVAEVRAALETTKGPHQDGEGPRADKD